MTTRFLTSSEAAAARDWHIIDAAGVPLGRLSSEVAALLRGKRNPAFAAHQDCGDYVIVINAAKVSLSGRKPEQKVYRHHTGYTGGLKEIPVARMMEEKPEEVIKKAVRGMLPKTTL
ncbi:MAG: 50S ribosomal protein L13, partial [Bdellovibrionales bacterium]|nr:50S ribosomal protein L13 [Bdellovibrionales bacterium]